MTINKTDKKLFFGTAMWGWGIDKQAAFNMLNAFIENGGVYVDTATNYPIDKAPQHFGLAIDWLSEWVSIYGEQHLKILVKIGSIDNSGNDRTNLSASNIEKTRNYLDKKLDSSLSCISVHWDNRDDFDSIGETVNALNSINKSGLDIGISGIMRPDLYYKSAPELDGKWIIQAKNNLVTTGPVDSYLEYFTKSKCLAYGINMGGLKRDFDPSSSMTLRGIKSDDKILNNVEEFLLSNYSLKPKPTSLNELSLALSYLNPKLDGVIIGPRNIDQLLNSIVYWNLLHDNKNVDDSVKYQELITILTK